MLNSKLYSKITPFLVGAGLLLAPNASELLAQARVQVVHNSPDPAAGQVDVWINGVREVNNLNYKRATGYVNFPAGTPTRIHITGTDATDTVGALFRTTVNLDNNVRYQVIASGVATIQVANPDGRSTGLTLFVKANSQEIAPDTLANFFIVHGSPNAPTVDVRARGVAPLAGDAAYGDITPIISVPASSYTIDLLNRAGDTVIASFTAPLGTIPAANRAFSVIATGILGNATTPFGLMAVLNNGDVIELPAAAAPVPARVQVIHNSADTLAREVDIYLNGKLALNNVPFRAATGFINMPSTTPLTVAIAPAASTSAAEAVHTVTYNLPEAAQVALVANGLVDGSRYLPNPSAIDRAFRLTVVGGAVINNSLNGQTSLKVVHGATDAPAVGLNNPVGGAAITPDTLNFGEQTPYLNLPSASTSFFLAPLPNLVFTAPLQALRDSGVIVVASGFLNNTGTQASRPFALLAVTPAGRVIPLSVVNSSRETLNPARLQAWPNPVVNGQLRFRFTAAGQSYRTEILSLDGKIISTDNLGLLDGGVFDFQTVAPQTAGMYILRLSDSQGRRTQVRFAVK